MANYISNDRLRPYNMDSDSHFMIICQGTIHVRLNRWTNWPWSKYVTSLPALAPSRVSAIFASRVEISDFLFAFLKCDLYVHGKNMISREQMLAF